MSGKQVNKVMQHRIQSADIRSPENGRRGFVQKMMVLLNRMAAVTFPLTLTVWILCSQTSALGQDVQDVWSQDMLKNELGKSPPEMAKMISTLTGMAISPLLGAAVLGAWEYFFKDVTQRHWYASPFVWIPGLIIVVFFFIKDVILGLFPAVKKPIDAVEVIVNKVSGVVMIALVIVPGVFEFFGQSPQSEMALASSPVIVATAPLMGSLWSSGHGILLFLATSLSVLAFAVVWLASHSINVLIMVNPFGVIDVLLKGIQLAMLSLLVVAALVHPYVGGLISIAILIIAVMVAGWSFRLTVFGTVFAWDLLLLRHLEGEPAEGPMIAFSARKIGRAKARSLGNLKQNEDKSMAFVYRPWLVFRKKTVALPGGQHVIGKGLISPALMCAGKEDDVRLPLVIFPPRYRSHERKIAERLGIEKVEEIGVLKGIRTAMMWIQEACVGSSPEQATWAQEE